MSRTADDTHCGNRVEYKHLESRIYDSYYRASVSEDIVEQIFGKSEYLDLCRFTRNTYTLFTNNPELLSKTLNEDDAHLYWFNATLYGKPKLKVNMRKALKAMSNFIQFIWNIAILSKNNEIIKIPAKYNDLLNDVGIIVKDNKITSHEYPGMFDALRLLSADDNGFERFIRCVYDEDSNSYKSIFGPMLNNAKLFDDFIRGIEKRGYKNKINLNSGGVKSFEGAKSYWTKNLDGKEDPSNLSMYDRTNYGIHIDFSVLLKDQLILFLLVQDIRKVLEMFDTLDESLQKFIVKNHARCNNCGYCTQRNKNRAVAVKPYTIPI